MEEKITLCGDNCIECPRSNAHSEEELQNVAKLWYRVGWRDCVVSSEEIRCEGCSSHKQCIYHLALIFSKKGKFLKILTYSFKAPIPL